MTNIDALRVMLPPDDNSSELLLTILLQNAENLILDYIGRAVLPERLNDMVVQVAAAMYNRLGNEGEEKRTENDISVSFSSLITEDMKMRLRNYPRKVGCISAADTQES